MAVDAARRQPQPSHDARLAVHRPARVRPIQRRACVRRGAPVRAGRLRRVSLLHHGQGRQSSRHHRHPHRRPLDRHRPHPRLRPPGRACGRRSAGGRCSSSRTPTGSPTRPPTRCSSRSRSPPRTRCGCCALRRSRTSWSPSAPAAGRAAPHPVGGGHRRAAGRPRRHRAELAHAAAAASQGHIGRALGLARDPVARDRRRAILALPLRVGTSATASPRPRPSTTRPPHARPGWPTPPTSARSPTCGRPGRRGSRPSPGGLCRRALDAREGPEAPPHPPGPRLDRRRPHRPAALLPRRHRRPVRSGTDLVNADVADDVATVARVWTPESTLRRIDAIVECREAFDANAAPQLALERMMIGFSVTRRTSLLALAHRGRSRRRDRRGRPSSWW